MEILYIDNNKTHKRLPNYLNIQNGSITIYNQKQEPFGITVINGEAEIYSVYIDSTTNEPVISKILSPPESFNNGTNYQYTIYPKTKDILIACQDGLTQQLINYQFEFEPYQQPDHYETILINRDLPSYDELQRCIVFTDQYDKTDLVARMLLDVNDVLRYKGNILGIKKFLNFVGFPDSTFDLFREYQQPNGQKTINPNKATDIPTGYYALVIRDYYEDIPSLTRKNLPNLQNLINDDIDEFVDKLKESFAIAMRYFTLPEQDISFIGFETSSNGMGFVSVAGNTNMIAGINPQLFYNNIRIDIKNHETSTLFTSIVKRNIQTPNNVVYKSEVKYIPISSVIRDIMVINQEVFDDVEDIQLDSGIARIFGYINHIHIASPDTYVEVHVTGVNNIFINLLIPKQFVGDSGLYIPYLCTQSGKFKVEIRIWDLHNNMEVFNYEYECSESIINASFNVYTSHQLIETNSITLDVDSTAEITNTSINYVLPLNQVPVNLSEYYDILYSPTDVRYLTNNKRYRTSTLNYNYSVDSLTETIPVDFIDNYQHIIGIPLTDEMLAKSPQLVLRPKSISKILSETGDYFPLTDVYSHSLNFEDDELFVTVLDITIDDQGTIQKHLLITTKSSSVDVIPDMFDLGILTDDGVVVPIYDIPNLTSTRIQVNYDYPLFHREIETPLVPITWPIYDEAWKPVAFIKSLFPRLVPVESKLLYYGDYILAVIDTDTIVNQKNILWEVLNAFTNEVLFTSNDASLKYQINEHTVYTIKLTITINNIINQEQYTVDARNIVSSFNFRY